MPVDIRTISESIAVAIDMAGVSESLDSISLSVSDISKKMDKIKSDSKGGGIVSSIIGNLSLKKNLETLSELEFKSNIDKESIESVQNILELVQTIKKISEETDGESLENLDNLFGSINKSVRKLAFTLIFAKTAKKSVDSIKYIFSAKGIPFIIKRIPELGIIEKSNIALNGIIKMSKLLTKLFLRLTLTGGAAILTNILIKQIKKAITNISSIINKISKIESKDILKASTILNAIKVVVSKIEKILLKTTVIGILAVPAIIGATAGAIALQAIHLLLWSTKDFSLAKLRLAKTKAVNISTIMSGIGIAFVAAAAVGILAVPAAVGLIAASITVTLMGKLFKLLGKVTKHVAKGAVSMLLIAGSLTAMAFAFKKISDTKIDFKNMLAFAGTIVAAVGAVSLAGLAIIPIVVGSAAIGVMGLGLMLFAGSLSMIDKLGNIDYAGIGDNIGKALESITKGLTAAGALSIVAPIVGTLLIPMSLGLLAFAASIAVWGNMSEMEILEQSEDSKGNPILKHTGKKIGLDTKVVAQNIADTVNIINTALTSNGGGAEGFLKSLGKSVGSSVIGTLLIPMSLGLLVFAATVAVWGNLNDMEVMEQSTDANGNVTVKRTGEKINLDTQKVAQNIADTVNIINTALTTNGEGVKGFFKSLGKSVGSSVIGTLLIPMSLGLLSFAAAVAVWGNMADMEVMEQSTDANGNVTVKRTGEKVKLDTKKVAQNVSTAVMTLINGINWDKIDEDSKDSMKILGKSLRPLSRGLIRFAKALAAWGSLESLQQYDSEGKPVGDPIKVDIKKITTNMNYVLTTIANTINTVAANGSVEKAKTSMEALKTVSEALSNFVLSIASFSKISSEKKVPIFNRVTGKVEDYVECDIDKTVDAIGSFITKLSETLNKVTAGPLFKRKPDWSVITSVSTMFTHDAINNMLAATQTREGGTGYILCEFADAVSGFFSKLGSDEFSKHFKKFASSDVSNSIDNIQKLGESIKVIDGSQESLPKISTMVTNVVDKINTLDIDKTAVLTNFFESAKELANPRFKVEQGIEYIKELCNAIVEELKLENSSTKETNTELKNISTKVDNKTKDVVEKQDKEPVQQIQNNNQPQEVRLYLNDIENIGNGWRILPA